ncbi:hypothetical protein LWM68_19545 [Niabella sp. W65]|nr:hypothetical protein [Niabella sp. W65]MCH7364761.1 hypothetical protein [Niabella sp. W65]
MDSVISGYRYITGKAPIVPKWALGFWQSRERYKTQDEVLSAVSEFRKRKIPLDNIVLDWNYWREPEWGSQEFDESRFADPDQMIDVLHKKYHTQLMISVWPKFYEGITAYNDFDKKDGCINAILPTGSGTGSEKDMYPLFTMLLMNMPETASGT